MFKTITVKIEGHDPQYAVVQVPDALNDPDVLKYIENELSDFVYDNFLHEITDQHKLWIEIYTGNAKRYVKCP